MNTIKAKDVKVGMEIAGDLVAEVIVVSETVIQIDFQSYDVDCGEVEYFPCEFHPEEEISLEPEFDEDFEYDEEY